MSTSFVLYGMVYKILDFSLWFFHFLFSETVFLEKKRVNIITKMCLENTFWLNGFEWVVTLFQKYLNHKEIRSDYTKNSIEKWEEETINWKWRKTLAIVLSFIVYILVYSSCPNLWYGHWSIELYFISIGN